MHHLVGSRPAVGSARHLRGIGDLGREQRTLGAQPSEHILAERVVRREPLRAARPPRPAPHRRQHERQQAHRAERAVVLEQQPVGLGGFRQVQRVVARANARPEDGVLGRGDGVRRVDLDRAELLGDLDDVGGAVRIQQLRAHAMRRASSRVSWCTTSSTLSTRAAWHRLPAERCERRHRGIRPLQTEGLERSTSWRGPRPPPAPAPAPNHPDALGTRIVDSAERYAIPASRWCRSYGVDPHSATRRDVAVHVNPYTRIDIDTALCGRETCHRPA